MEEEEHLMDDFTLDPDTTCSSCFAEFLDAEDLALHVRQVHYSGSSRRCQFCTSLILTSEEYARHIRDQHLITLKACKYCNKIFNDYDAVRRHENKHFRLQDRSLFFCSQCGKNFKYEYELCSHEGKYHDNNLDGVLLNDCLNILTSLLNMKALTFITSLRENSAYVCTSCVYTTSNPNDYLNHLTLRNCQCTVCDKCSNVYKDRKNLIYHLRKHKECWNVATEEQLMKTCSKCKEKVDAADYKQHVKLCKPIKCNICELVLKSMYDLTTHQSQVHPMAITMQTCKLCHIQCVGNTALQKHINRKHKPEIHLYKYTCVYCKDMYFKHPQKMFAHFYSNHHDLMPYSCKICNTTYRIRKKFTIHIKLEHNSIGFVEFDDKYHVYFSDKKSENPFIPKILFPDMIPQENRGPNDNNKNDNRDTDLTTDATDFTTDVPTDAQTDGEDTKKRESDKIPPKMRFKQARSKEIQSSNMKLNLHQSKVPTENLKKRMRPTKITKRKCLQRKFKREVFHEPTPHSKPYSDSDDEPLIKIKRTMKKKKPRPKRFKDGNAEAKKQRFTCNICKKYCYTFQHYHYHMSLHFNDETKKCIKCSKEFLSKAELNAHTAKEHSTSRLTETLKHLLEKRKQTKNGTAPTLTTKEKIQKTIKKCRSEPVAESVTIKEVSDKLSVQKFIESFTPEETSKKSSINNKEPFSVSIKAVTRAITKPPVIKMTKFNPKPAAPHTTKLAMPTHFKEVPTDRPKVHVRMIQKPIIEHDETENADESDHDQVEDYDGMNPSVEFDEPEEKHTVPEMAQEVMLETQEQHQTQNSAVSQIVPHKIIIPKLPQNCNNNDIRIAHLLPEAPFFKIVKMREVLNEDQKKKVGRQEVEEERQREITLPGGAKLVNVNPLAHLIGDTPVEKLVPKTYKPKKAKVKDPPNYEAAIAKALINLEHKVYKKKPKKKTGENLEMNQSFEVEQ